MGGDIWGGGMIVAVAAGLWLAYLVPTWLRRREYLATERNALRLQQTMRILAETAEVPQEIRVEMTARNVAAQEKVLRRAEARAKAAADAGRKVAGAAAASRSLLRRSRAATSLVLLASILVIGWGVYQGVAEASWQVVIVGGVVALGAVVVLARLARAGRAQPPVRVPASTAMPQELYDHGGVEETEPVVEQTWTPQPLPKPTYLSPGSVAATSMASADAVAQLRRAATRADLDLRAAQLSPEVAPLPTRPSRFASMGIVEDAPDASIDLDAVLRRRRAG